MKKTFLSIAIICLLITSCEKEKTEVINETDAQEIDMSDFYLYVEENNQIASKSTTTHTKCQSMKNLAYRLEKNKGLAKKMYDIEFNTRKLIAAKKPNNPGGGNGGGGGGSDPIYTGDITIPVVINILETNIGEVTDAHINSQIAILNEDFNNANPGTVNVPGEFASIVADVNINFVLANVVRKVSSETSWGTNDKMKDASQGGIDATDTSRFLNIWVCKIGGGILGYAQFPGGSVSTDGVVIGTDFFGENNAGGIYGHGRTATHEVGHWLNLRHIWGDGRCNRDDFVDDTPKSDRANYNCPTYPTVHCRSNDMTMNYMDYVQDDCMYMFSSGQNDRMRTLFSPGGAKESFIQ